MFLPWHSLARPADYRFVFIGAGPAGLHLAQLLAARGRVLVVEAGNTDDTTSSGDDMYQLDVTGLYYPELGTRLSAFGGTSNHWGGHSRPFAREIFADRPGIPGWPIDYDAYAAYLDGAGKFLNLAPFDPPGGPLSITSGVLAGHEHLTATPFLYSNPIVRLGDPGFVSAMSVHPDIDVLMDTRLLDIDLSPDGARVEAISLLHRPSHETAMVPVSRLFLCAGAIENARILLWSGRKYARGNPLLGGPNELTGTHFQEKPNFWPVELFVDSRADLSGTAIDFAQPHLCWELTEAFRLQHGLPRFGVFPGTGTALSPDDPLMEAVSKLYAHEAVSYVRLDPTFQWEQTPSDASFVKLSGDRDSDGVARAQLHWEISAADRAAYRKATLLFCGILSQNGVARGRFRPAFEGEDWSDVYIEGCNHHIGTTRMGKSSQDGVVDGDCRVFGIDNLFVAGSSVFPSGDYVNPTLNLVALAGRLADHVLRLDGELS